MEHKIHGEEEQKVRMEMLARARAWMALNDMLSYVAT